MFRHKIRVRTFPIQYCIADTEKFRRILWKCNRHAPCDGMICCSLLEKNDISKLVISDRRYMTNSMISDDRALKDELITTKQ